MRIICSNNGIWDTPVQEFKRTWESEEFVSFINELKEIPPSFNQDILNFPSAGGNEPQWGRLVKENTGIRILLVDLFWS